MKLFDVFYRDGTFDRAIQLPAKSQSNCIAICVSGELENLTSGPNGLWVLCSSSYVDMWFAGLVDPIPMKVL
jgi:hypothetical protein